MIDIWSHNWLPDVGQSRVFSPRNGARVGKVCDLFYPNSKIWDPGLIQHTFYPWEAEKIMRIHVSAVNTEDTLVWPLSPDGEYSVKSAYRMLAAEVTNGLPSSSGGACSLLWKRIWKIHAPQRIKHFIWRAAKDSLPTKQNLVRRQIPVDVTCSLCEDYQETLLHALWLCDQAKAVWKSDSRFSELYRKAHRSFVDLLDSVFEQGSVFFVALFSTIAWSLWQRRNKLRERQPTWPIQEIYHRAKELVVEFFEVHQRPMNPVRHAPHVKWLPPAERGYKANFDAAFFENSELAGIGVVVRDSSGNVMGALSQKIPKPQSVEHAEALAACKAVILVKELLLSQACFEGDCQRVIQAINACGPSHTLFGHIIEEIHCFNSALACCSFVHIRREGNKLAHAPARRAVLSADTDVWVEELPNDLDDVFRSDLVQ